MLILQKFVKPIKFISSNKTIVKNAITYDTNSTKCNIDIITFSVDTILFAFSLVGLKVENEERLTRALIRELGPETLNGIGRLAKEFAEANTALEKTRKLFSVLKLLYDSHAINAAIKIVKNEMSWKEWIKVGLLAAAQITAWFATDSVAFIGECVLVIMSADDLINDAKSINKNC